MVWIDKLERKYGRHAVPGVLRYIIAFQVVLYFLAGVRPAVVEAALLIPAQVLEGELWRLVSFVFLPPGTAREPISLIFAFFYWYLLWIFGSSLEQQWGAFRLNLFLLIGYLATMAFAFVQPFSGMPATNEFLYLTLFLAFARIYPNFELLLFFILPVKVKWLAMIMWVIFGFQFLLGSMMVKLGVLAAVLNFAVFFGREIWLDLRQVGRQAKRKAVEASPAAAVAMHTCSVCQATEHSHPERDFRYDDDGTCFCEEHLEK